MTAIKQADPEKFRICFILANGMVFYTFHALSFVIMTSELKDVEAQQPQNNAAVKGTSLQEFFESWMSTDKI